MFKRILVPLDLSEKSLKAADVAYDFAAKFGSKVVLLHVIETIEHMTFDELKPFYSQLEKSARTGLQKVAERFLTKRLAVDQSVVYGHRTKEILDCAARESVDLIVMASHRIDPNPRGHESSSISYAVAILSPCPVLLVK
jgi:nucleotide-binding universal stress UspA family protein